MPKTIKQLVSVKKIASSMGRLLRWMLVEYSGLMVQIPERIAPGRHVGP